MGGGENHMRVEWPLQAGEGFGTQGYGFCAGTASKIPENF